VNDPKLWNEPNLSTTKAKRQHYVPKLLLRSFAIEGKVRVFDLDEHKEYRTSVANAAVESQFYNENAENLELSAEEWLARLEGNATPVLDGLLDNPNNILSLSIDKELHLARFLAALRFRTPVFRDFIDNMQISVLQQIKDMVKKQIYHQHSNKRAEAIWEELERKPTHWWFSESEPEQSASTANFMLGEVQGYANLFRAAPWRIGFAPDSIRLYTSDNPVAGYLNPVRPWWETGAFASLSYFVPLSPKILLKIERRPDQKKGEELKPCGERLRKDFSQWEISFARHVVTSDAKRYLYGEGPIVPKDCATSCLERIGSAELEFAIRYLDFDPRPPSSV